MTHPDSRILLVAALLLAAAPAMAAAPKTAAKPAKPAAKMAVVDSDPSGTLISQARIAQAQGENDLALRLAQSAIVAAPARTAPYVALGDVYAAAGEADFARDYYEQALNIDPVDAGALKAIAGLDRAPAQRTAVNNGQGNAKTPGTP